MKNTIFMMLSILFLTACSGKNISDEVYFDTDISEKVTDDIVDVNLDGDDSLEMLVEYIDPSQEFKLMIPIIMSNSEQFEVRVNTEKYDGNKVIEFIDGSVVGDIYTGGTIFEIIISSEENDNIPGDFIFADGSKAYYYNPTTGMIENTGFSKLVDIYSEYYDQIGKSITMVK